MDFRHTFKEGVKPAYGISKVLLRCPFVFGKMQVTIFKIIHWIFKTKYPI
jgi:hypothetical protein